MKIEKALELLWQDYTQLNPSTKKIHDLFLEREDKIYNDHIAFRSFGEDFGIDFLARFFTEEGYEKKGDYDFEQKKLNACHYQHPNEDFPKIFISELKLREFSPFLQETIKDCLKSIGNEEKSAEDAFVKGRLWPAYYETYLKLAEESEYAGWLYAFGFRANHFTVNVNRLKSFQSLEEVNTFIENAGFELNDSGGKIKGGPKELLEQSSTKAKKVAVNFEDGQHEIPACYYEFAKRYKDPDGNLYQGFVAANADKIFESTDRY